MRQDEACGEEFGDGGLSGGTVASGEDDEGVGAAELEDGLATGSAGLTGGAVEIGDGDGADTDARAVECDRCCYRVLLGAASEAIGGVLDVTAGDDGCMCSGWGAEEECRSDPEVAVGCVGVVGCSAGVSLQQIDVGCGERCGWESEGHDESEAIGCGWVRQGGGRWHHDQLALKAWRVCPIRHVWTT